MEWRGGRALRGPRGRGLLAAGTCASLSAGLLALAGPAAMGSSPPADALAAAFLAGPVGSAVGTTTLPDVTLGSTLPLRAVRRATALRGWTPGTVRLATSALRRVFTYRVTASGPAGRRVLVQRTKAGVWHTLAVTRTGFGAGHAFRVALVVPRGTTAWRLLLPRTATASGVGTGTKRFVLGGTPAGGGTPAPTGGSVTISVAPTATPATGPGEGATHANHYSFISGGGSALTAARWDRCRPIRVTSDFARVAKAGLSAVGERARWIGVLTKVAAASGYRFVWLDSAPGRGKLRDDGSIAGMPTQTYPGLGGAFAPGAAHADVVVTYASAYDTGAYLAPALHGSELGYGGPAWRELGSPSRRQNIAGEVVLDYTDIKGLALRPGNLTDLYLHEFGHAMGLGHVSDVTQVMTPSLDLGLPILDYRRGDREGLRSLELQPCTTT